MYKKRLNVLNNLRGKKKEDGNPGEISWGHEAWTWSQNDTADELTVNLVINRKEELMEALNECVKRGEDPLFRAFAEKYGQPELVYYPCSWLHITPSFTFKNVVYADIDQESMLLLMREGYEAIKTDVTELESIWGEQADLIILFNPQVHDLDALTKPLKVGGYVICNNYHETADDLRRNPNFLFIESLDGIGDGGFIPMTEESRESKNPFAPKTMGKCLFKKVS